MIPKIGTLGQIAETKAAKFLRKQGLKLIQKNFHCQYGEIDIVMYDGQTIVFVEVRFRHNNDYGNALESITLTKQAKLVRTAQSYLMKNKLGDAACRFDVVGLSGNIKRPKITWIADAIS